MLQQIASLSLLLFLTMFVCCAFPTGQADDSRTATDKAHSAALACPSVAKNPRDLLTKQSTLATQGVLVLDPPAFMRDLHGDFWSNHQAHIRALLPRTAASTQDHFPRLLAFMGDTERATLYWSANGAEVSNFSIHQERSAGHYYFFPSSIERVVAGDGRRIIKHIYGFDTRMEVVFEEGSAREEKNLFLHWDQSRAAKHAIIAPKVPAPYHRDRRLWKLGEQYRDWLRCAADKLRPKHAHAVHGFHLDNRFAGRPHLFIHRDGAEYPEVALSAYLAVTGQGLWVDAPAAFESESIDPRGSSERIAAYEGELAAGVAYYKLTGAAVTKRSPTSAHFANPVQIPAGKIALLLPEVVHVVPSDRAVQSLFRTFFIDEDARSCKALASTASQS